MFKKLLYAYGVYRFCILIDRVVESTVKNLNKEIKRIEHDRKFEKDREKNDEIRKLYADGYSPEEIKDLYGYKFCSERVDIVCMAYDKSWSKGEEA